MSSLSLDPAQAGSLVGTYRLVALLGRGGMAEVHLALSQGPAGFSKLLVIKKLLAGHASDPRLRAMFLEEARLAARLNHPNIVQTNAVCEDGDSHFMVMEYIEGQPLSALVRKLRPRGIPLASLLRIVSDACAGLHYVHALADVNGAPLGLVHRDISPQNLLLTYTGQVKIVDFGIAKAAGLTAETEVGITKGKAGYMSPEQALGREVDGRSDLFSLGVVLYEALVKERIWGPRATDVDVLRRLLIGDVPRKPSRFVPDLHADLDHICRRALAPDLAERYPSALHMQEDVERCIARLPVQASARSLGELVAGLFAEERASLAAAVRRQLGALEVGGGAATGGYHAGLASAPAGSPEECAPTEVHAELPSLREAPDARRRQSPMLVSALAALCVAAIVATGSFQARRPAGAPPSNAPGLALAHAASPPFPVAAMAASEIAATPVPATPAATTPAATAHAEFPGETPPVPAAAAAAAAPATSAALGASAPPSDPRTAHADPGDAPEHPSLPSRSPTRRTERRAAPAPSSRPASASKPAVVGAGVSGGAGLAFGPLDDRK